MLSKCYQNSIQMLTECYQNGIQNATRMLSSACYHNDIMMLSEHYQKAIKMLSACYQRAITNEYFGYLPNIFFTKWILLTILFTYISILVFTLVVIPFARGEVQLSTVLWLKVIRFTLREKKVNKSINSGQQIKKEKKKVSILF